MDIVTPTIVFVCMLGAYYWGHRDGQQRGIVKGVNSLFWWFESKAGVQQVNGWIRQEPDANLKESLINVDKYRRCDEVIGLILNRSDDESSESDSTE